MAEWALCGRADDIEWPLGDKVDDRERMVEWPLGDSKVGDRVAIR